VRGANVGRAEIRPLRIEPEIGKPLEDAVQASSAEGGRVLDEDVGRLRFGDDALHLEPEAASLAGEAGAAAGEGDVLARKAAGDEIHPLKRTRIELRDIASDHSFAAEAGSEDVLAPRVDLDGSDEVETEQAPGEETAPDAGEKVELTEHQRPSSRATRTTTPTLPPEGV
jgi:hypothetical protein